ncbi:GNAT family N-acetyltransferase [Entamoeba marina]
MSLIDILKIYQARNNVFVVEQHICCQDMDEIDKNCKHIYYMDNDAILAYCRIYQDSNISCIGRVLVHNDYRNKGFGKELILKAIDYSKTHFPTNKIHVHAQYQTIPFYEKLGFTPVGEVYYEVNIQHKTMEYE